MLDRLEDILEEIRGEYSDMWIIDSESRGASRYLADVFLGRYIDRGPRWSMVILRILSKAKRFVRRTSTGASRSRRYGERGSGVMSAKIEFFRGFSRKPVGYLERERGLSDPGLSGEEDEAPGSESATEDSVELGTRE